MMSKVKGETGRRAETEEHAKDVDLVFEEGDLKSIALVGAYPVLEERGYKHQNMAAASARGRRRPRRVYDQSPSSNVVSLSMAPVAFAVMLPTEWKKPGATRTSG